MDPRNQACRFIYPEKHGQARKSNHVCIHEYMYIYTYTHESVNPPPFNPTSIIGYVGTRGWFSSGCRGAPLPLRHPRTVVFGIRSERKGGGGWAARDHALFPVVAFDVDGPGHSERLIENFLRLWNGTRGNGTPPSLWCRRKRMEDKDRGREGEGSIYLTSKTIRDLALDGFLRGRIPNPDEWRGAEFNPHRFFLPFPIGDENRWFYHGVLFFFGEYWVG